MISFLKYLTILWFFLSKISSSFSSTSSDSFDLSLTQNLPVEIRQHIIGFSDIPWQELTRVHFSEIKHQRTSTFTRDFIDASFVFPFKAEFSLKTGQSTFTKTPNSIKKFFNSFPPKWAIKELYQLVPNLPDLVIPYFHSQKTSPRLIKVLSFLIELSKDVDQPQSRLEMLFSRKVKRLLKKQDHQVAEVDLKIIQELPENWLKKNNLIELYVQTLEQYANIAFSLTEKNNTQKSKELAYAALKLCLSSAQVAEKHNLYNGSNFAGRKSALIATLIEHYKNYATYCDGEAKASILQACSFLYIPLCYNRLLVNSSITENVEDGIKTNQLAYNLSSQKDNKDRIMMIINKLSDLKKFLNEHKKINATNRKLIFQNYLTEEENIFTNL